MAKQPKFMDSEAFKKLTSGSDEQDTTDVVLRKQFALEELKMIDEEKLLIDFVISTDSIDRMHDTIDQKGWDLKAYKKNPVVLFAHDSREPPVAKASKLTKGDGKLTARAEFTPQDLYPFGYMIFQMYAKGFMKATSVGFRPLKYEYTEEDDRPYGIDFLKQELLEFSAVPVPANPEALIDVKAAGIDLEPLKVWAEKILDEWDEHAGLMIPKNVVESIRKQSDSKGKQSYRVPKTVQEELLRKNLIAIKIEAEKAEQSLEEVSDAIKASDTPVVEEEQEDEPEAMKTLVVNVTTERLLKTIKDLQESLSTQKETEFVMENEEFEKLLSDLIDTSDVLLDVLETNEELKVDSRQSRRLVGNTVDSLKALTSALKDFTKDLASEESKDLAEGEENDLEDLPEGEEPVKSKIVEEEASPEEVQKEDGAGVIEYTSEEVAKAVGELLPGIVSDSIKKSLGKV